MSGRAGAHWQAAGWRAAIAGLLRDRRGVAALEFALIVPLLLSMYFVTMEVSQAIETNKKVGRVGSMVADLVTQQQTITKAELDAIMRSASRRCSPTTADSRRSSSRRSRSPTRRRRRSRSSGRAS